MKNLINLNDNKFTLLKKSQKSLDANIFANISFVFIFKIKQKSAIPFLPFYITYLQVSTKSAEGSGKGR
jgi:hypothetical protein